jgi:membrane protease YdiL (CAAX protease family)
MYLVAGVILFTQVGPWEAVRKVLVNGLIVAAWLWSANKILHDTPTPDSAPIRYPQGELAWTLAALLALVAMAANGYGGWIDLPRWLYYLVGYGAVLALFLVLRYPLRELGLGWPPRRGWLALGAVILINVAAAALFLLLPAGEVEAGPQADLSSQITGPWAVLVLLAQLLVNAALPEEMLFRVTLQPRLAHYLPVGWAILLQAFLFNASHLPQHLLRDQQPWSLALAGLLLIDNGLIAGLLWHRTRSLPLLLVLHLFAFPRFGV